MSSAKADRISSVVLARKRLRLSAFIGRQPASETKRSVYARKGKVELHCGVEEADRIRE